MLCIISSHSMLTKQLTCHILLLVHSGPGPCPESRGQGGVVFLCYRISLFCTHTPEEEESKERKLTWFHESISDYCHSLLHGL